jgi:hypothetical protein
MVADQQAPVLSGVPTNISKVVSSAGGIGLNYTLPYHWDIVDGRASLTASKMPGSLFPVGKTIVTFRATDAAGNQSTATMEVNITRGSGTLPTIGGIPRNKLPEIRTPNDQYVIVNKTKTLNLEAYDDDGDAVTFRLLNAPSYARIEAPDPVTRKAKLVIEPRPGDPFGTTIARIEATDSKGGKSVTLPFRIMISEFETVESGDGSGPGGPPDPGTGVGGGGGGGGSATNKPPTAVAKSLPATIKATTKQGGVLQVDGSLSSDPDLDVLSFEWRANGLVFSREQIGSATLAVGVYQITLTVSDGKGGVSTTAPQSVEILPRDLTITSASPARILQFGQQTITVTGTGFVSDPDPAKQTKLRIDCNSFCQGGSLVTVTINSIEEDTIIATIRTTQKTPLGNRDAVVSNPNGATAKLLRSNFVAP